MECFVRVKSLFCDFCYSTDILHFWFKKQKPLRVRWFIFVRYFNRRNSKKKPSLTVREWSFLLNFGHIFRKIVIVANKEINGF